MSLNSQFRIYGSPLSRPKVAKFALVVLVVITVITTNILVKHVLTSRSSDQLRVFFLALFCSSLLSIVPITVLRFLDRREQKSTWLYVITFVCGALIATGIALPINGIIGENIEQFLLVRLRNEIE
jgi:protease PrsW